MKPRDCVSLGVALLALAGAAAAQESYIGAAACVSCHDRQGRWLRGSVHEKAPAKEGEEPGCEACHGPGSRHLESPAVDTIITFRIEEEGLRSGRCLRCHKGVRTGRHLPEQVACNDCHARTNSEGFHRLRAGQAARQVPSRACRRCHQNLSASHDPKQARHEDCLACPRGFHRPGAGRRGGALR
jgi:hypothetical protein